MTQHDENIYLLNTIVAANMGLIDMLLEPEKHAIYLANYDVPITNPQILIDMLVRA
jgi:hypothetical protein